ncbi:MAG: Ig-like domain-containing protein [Verrucomicrobia bacterium]|nr:Ig-like domain-containing protein [Verrucomicrobiota bacterium]
MKKLCLMGAVQGALVFVVLMLARSGFAQGGIFPPPPDLGPPVVSIYATDPSATWAGGSGSFTVTRTGSPFLPLNVVYRISGTASNGVDYQTISDRIYIPMGVLSRDIIIHPLTPSQTLTKTVVLELTNAPVMGGGGTSVSYIIGSSSNATVTISSGPETNVPPMVTIAYPKDNGVYYAPASIPVVACAKDMDGMITNVEFFADNLSLGSVTNPVSILPPMSGWGMGLPPMPPYRPLVLVWSNAPAGAHVLTAKATDNRGASTVSGPVHITVNAGPLPPPTNTPPIVRITSPANHSMFHAPVNLPIYAFATDRNNYVTNVEFFSGTNDLGHGRQLSAAPPSPGPMPPPISFIQPTNYWVLVWSNAPQGDYSLTAVATDNRGASTVSDPVNITILPPLPPPTVTNLVSIFATDPIAIEGTNCWPWLGLAGSASTWANWNASNSVCGYFTNCGPKSALFTVRRLGETNSDLTVPYNIGGTASNGVEYVTLPGAVTISAGQRSAMITIVPIDDGQSNMTSTVILKLKASSDYMVDPRHNTAAAIILDHPLRLPGPHVLSDQSGQHLHREGTEVRWVHEISAGDRGISGHWAVTGLGHFADRQG